MNCASFVVSLSGNQNLMDYTTWRGEKYFRAVDKSSVRDNDGHVHLKVYLIIAEEFKAEIQATCTISTFRSEKNLKTT